MLSVFVQPVYTVKSGSDLCGTLNVGRVRVQKQTLKADSKSGLQKQGPKQRVWQGCPQVDLQMIRNLGHLQMVCWAVEKNTTKI